jgi:hypothetical protein
LALGLGVCEHVLVEPQLAAGTHDAVKLGERAVLVGHRAEHEAGDRRVDAFVIQR